MCKEEAEEEDLEDILKRLKWGAIGDLMSLLVESHTLRKPLLEVASIVRDTLESGLRLKSILKLLLKLRPILSAIMVEDAATNPVATNPTADPAANLAAGLRLELREKLKLALRLPPILSTVAVALAAGVGEVMDAMEATGAAVAAGPRQKQWLRLRLK